MTNAEKFVHLFGLYATELWSKNEKDFLIWLNAEYKNIHDANVGELIDRQAAIDTLMEILDRPNHAEFLYTDEICGVLKNLPSAQPKTKKGKWILKKELVPLPWDCTPLDYDNYDEDTHSEWREFYYCSECDWKSGEFKGGNFCPCCGADMREG